MEKKPLASFLSKYLTMAEDAEVSAPGVPPPISNPDENAGPAILGAVVSVTSLALIVVLTRVYVRGFMIRNLGWDVSPFCISQ